MHAVLHAVLHPTAHAPTKAHGSQQQLVITLDTLVAGPGGPSGGLAVRFSIWTLALLLLLPASIAASVACK